jgi:hypothetical protein
MGREQLEELISTLGRFRARNWQRWRRFAAKGGVPGRCLAQPGPSRQGSLFQKALYELEKLLHGPRGVRGLAQIEPTSVLHNPREKGRCGGVDVKSAHLANLGVREIKVELALSAFAEATARQVRFRRGYGAMLDFVGRKARVWGGALAMGHILVDMRFSYPFNSEDV